VLKEIIEEIEKRTEKAEGKYAVFSNHRYKAVEFSPSNYKDIGPGSNERVVFVDGGNAEILKAPGMSLQFIRNAAVTVKRGKVVGSRKREFYALAVTVENNKKLDVKVKIYDQGTEEITFKETEPSAACEILRKCSEIRFAVHSDGLVVIDGTLEAKNDLEKRHFDDLFFKANVAAVAKTTGLITDKGNSYSAMLDRDGAWYYHPVVEINSDFHRAEMFFAKLHEKSRHVFRCEVFNEQKDKIPEVVAQLKQNARELTFPGYPYGLILADRLARVSEREASYLKAKILAIGGSKLKNLHQSMSALDAHEVLDRI